MCVYYFRFASEVDRSPIPMNNHLNVVNIKSIFTSILFVFQFDVIQFVKCPINTLQCRQNSKSEE